jgi:hypothetical protein
MNARRVLAFLFAVCLLAVARTPGSAQDETNRYFPETGHNVQGDFLRFYEAASDPITVYGYPITEQFSRGDGLLVQYFQRARFEYHADLPDGQRVVPTDLGTALYMPSAQINISNPFACKSYAQGNFPVCFAFLDFYDRHGGPQQFGSPISPFEYHDGLIVQYFQRARMEWQPSNPEGERVVLTDLGSLYFDKLAEDAGRRDPVQPLDASIQPQVTALRVRASVWKAVTVASDRQAIFIVTDDQSGKPVEGAACTAALTWPDGTGQALGSLTNSRGVAILQVSYSDRTSGYLVPIAVTCQLRSGLSGSTSTSFRIWY